MDEISHQTDTVTDQDSPRESKSGAIPKGELLNSIRVVTRKDGKEVELSRAEKRRFFRLLKANSLPFPFDQIRELIAREKEAAVSGKPQEQSEKHYRDPREKNIRERCLNLAAGKIDRFLEHPPAPKIPLVANVLGAENIVILVGDGGAGKGFLVTQLAISIASGTPFLGNPDFAVSRPGAVLIINAEDGSAEVHHRLHTCFKRHTESMPPNEREMTFARCVENIHVPPIASSRFSLSGENKDCYKTALIEYAKEIPNLRLIVLDPANLLLLDDFNRSETVSQFVLDLKDIAAATGAMVMLVTHKNKTSGTGDLERKQAASAVLGSVSFVNAARLVLSVSVLDRKALASLDLPNQRNGFIALGIAKANHLAHNGQQAILERLDGGALRFVRYDDDSHTSDIVYNIISTNPGISQAEILTKAKDQSGLTREAVLHTLKELVGDEKITIKKGENNANLHYTV